MPLFPGGDLGLVAPGATWGSGVLLWPLQGLPPPREPAGCRCLVYTGLRDDNGQRKVAYRPLAPCPQLSLKWDLFREGHHCLGTVLLQLWDSCTSSRPGHRTQGQLACPLLRELPSCPASPSMGGSLA